MRISSGLGTILLLGLLHSSQSVAQDQIVPLDQSLTTKELIDVSAFIRFKEPWLFEFLRDEGLEFSSEILAVGRFDLNEDGREELSVAVIHPSDCGTGGCLMYVLERRDGELVLWPGRMSAIASWSGPSSLEVRLRRNDDGRWASR